MKDPKFRAKWGIAFNPSDEPNVDISCHKCNHLKNQMADVPFVWKLQYFNKYGIVIKTKRSLARSIRFQEDMTLTVKERDTALQCILRGDFEWLEHRVARFNFRQVSVDLSDGVVVNYLDARRKLPRKIKKKSI
ncbi:hypothetical protein EIZ39_03705 [Ammoniphilus sp. CFH 90114]|nr:hypothetical protein EIZ39_03705 [Ammoniphilus sp. CFH 90114]